mmetsp:Transcript_5924/g.9815  ORF Transcript_5924/g.9815 Transcript_5924/m.9815 type:complete len:300 (+) Transcript_5924:200-1099(+)|eukprot:CAMPEP_0196146970 /NCGR_PEP_ID=MMETSP0910-20130528/24276_1 /TAXON_ID=49265 /ORGANISM="Thalassiosira rotula, Strain GSO102" /LENGTH=299 /DNA_ID=CAMNT_0041409275 /DNA_START=479 /DNA_END=1378 /DNA_ORIENTATION=-
MKISSITLASVPLTATAFVPQTNSGVVSMDKMSLQAEAVSTLPSSTKPIFDPLGLYPENSPERMAGLIEPLETSMARNSNNDIVDPLRLYSDQSIVSPDAEMSASLPFVARPALLDGTLPGDRGFDPFNFASNPSALQWQRKAEIKHARLAMLASAGWPIAELLHKDIASSFHLPTLLASGDRVPSILNDGLSHGGFPAFWIATIAAASYIEFSEIAEENLSMKLNPAELGFDPLNLGGKTEEEQHYMQEAELFNGRLGMLAITGFAIQEWFLNSAVVDQIPIFFKPLNVAMEQLMNAQ